MKQEYRNSIANSSSLIMFSAFIFFLSCMNLSCKKDENQQQTVADEYYVKYIISSSTIYSGGKLNLIIKTEKNLNTSTIIDQKIKSETIIGPVSKGFNAKMSATAAGNTYDKLKLYTEIHVSKNNNPFALKNTNGSDTPRDQVELSYTIDY